MKYFYPQYIVFNSSSSMAYEVSNEVGLKFQFHWFSLENGIFRTRFNGGYSSTGKWIENSGAT